MRILTIGFTKSTAEHFFQRLKASGAQRVVDVRLHNVSQLAGFAKRDDLEYFLKSILHIEYLHLPDLAPTAAMLERYRRKGGDWEQYSREFLKLMRSRRIEKTVSRELIDQGCLLCSEDKPHHCHRRLVAEYLRDHWGAVDIQHL